MLVTPDGQPTHLSPGDIVVIFLNRSFLCIQRGGDLSSLGRPREGQLLFWQEGGRLGKGRRLSCDVKANAKASVENIVQMFVEAFGYKATWRANLPHDVMACDITP